MKVTREEFDFMLLAGAVAVPATRGGASGGSGRARGRLLHGRRAVAAAKGAFMQISVPGKGIKP